MVKISELPTASNVSASDYLVIVQSGVTKRATANLVPTSASGGTAVGTFSVTSYGASSDGVTDDTAAVTAAGQAASNYGGGTVTFPPGYTFINSNPTWFTNVTYQGVSTTAGIRRGANNLTVNVDKVLFRNLTFTRGSVGAHIAVTSSNVTFERCRFIEDSGNAPTNYGLVLDTNSTNAIVKDCTFTALKQCSIFLGASTNAQIINNRIINQSTVAGGLWSCIQMSGNCANAQVIGNDVRVDPSYTGNAINGISPNGRNIIIQGNYISSSRFAIEGGNKGNLTDGTGFGGVGGSYSNNTIVVSSTPLRNGQQNFAGCISLPYATWITIANNTIDQTGLDSGQQGYCAIELPDAAHCTVTGNILLGTTQQYQAIMLDGSFGNVVTANTIKGHCIGVNIYGHQSGQGPYPANDNIIQGNRIEFAATYATSSGVSVTNDPAGNTNRNIIVDNRITGPGNGGTGIILNRNNSSGTTDGNRVAGNVIDSVTTSISRTGDTNTVTT